MLGLDIDLPKTSGVNSKLITISEDKAADDNNHRDGESSDRYSYSQVVSSSQYDSRESMKAPTLKSSDKSGSWKTESDASSETELYLKVERDQPLTIVTKSGDHVAYRYHSKLAEGAYGQVLLYKTDVKGDKYPKELCIKVALRLGDLDADMKILEHIGSTKLNGVIPTIPMISEWSNTATSTSTKFAYPILIMPKMTGTVKQLFKEIAFPKLVDKYWMITGVLVSITRAFLSLVEHNIYYTDTKVTNCLYNLSNSTQTSRSDTEGGNRNRNGNSKGQSGSQPKQLTVLLCDIGGAALGDEKEAIATFPNIYRKRCHHFVPTSNDLQYGLLMLFFEMMSITNKALPNMGIDRDSVSALFHQNILELDLKQRKRTIVEIVTKISKLPGTNELIVKFLGKIGNHLYPENEEKEPKTHLNSLLNIFKTYHEHFSNVSKLSQVIKFK